MLKPQHEIKIKNDRTWGGKKRSMPSENRYYSLSVAFCQAREGLNLARPAAVVPAEGLSAHHMRLKSLKENLKPVFKVSPVFTHVTLLIFLIRLTSQLALAMMNINIYTNDLKILPEIL